MNGVKEVNSLFSHFLSDEHDTHYVFSTNSSILIAIISCLEIIAHKITSQNIFDMAGLFTEK